MTRKADFKLLLDDHYAPITSCIGFLEMEHPRAVEVFVTWQHEIYKPGGLADQHWAQLMRDATQIFTRVPLPAPREKRVEPLIRTSTIAGPLAHALEVLPPLTTGSSRRVLWVPTRSAWTAFFDNSLGGTDASGPIGHITCTQKCRGLRVDATPDTMGTKSLYDKTKRGTYGACIFELYGPEKTEWLNVVRAVEAVNDGGRWTFGASGTPQPYEEPKTYKARRVRDKFPFELLDKYCRALGLRPFDEDFYLPPEQPSATMIEQVWPPEVRAKDKEYTIAEVQAGVPWFGKISRDDQER